MRRPRIWLWVTLFVILVLVVGVLATGWSVVLVAHYHQTLQIARDQAQGPWAAIFLGTAGFIAVLTLVIAFFAKIVKEMRLNQRQAEFLATVSHELKTPLAAMELSASLLRSGGLSPDEVERLWTSHDVELKRLRDEVETLLEAARWQAGAAQLKKSPVLLEDWLTRSFERWRKILGPGATIERSGASFAEACALLDERSLNLIVDNFIDNARKFSSGPARVTIESSRERAPGGPARWRLTVRDHGMGFDPDISNKLFERFFRARTEAPYAIPGSGLGLYLAASASRAMKLRIRAKSEGVGRGAAFTVEGAELS